jgi:hypothetical protein
VETLQLSDPLSELVTPMMLIPVLVVALALVIAVVASTSQTQTQLERRRQTQSTNSSSSALPSGSCVSWRVDDAPLPTARAGQGDRFLGSTRAVVGLYSGEDAIFLEDISAALTELLATRAPRRGAEGGGRE